MLCYDGTIITLDKDNHIYKYLVEDQGIILYIGNEIPEQYIHVEKRELQEKVLLPSFCDTHEHFLSFSLFHSGLNVMNVQSNKEMQALIKDYVSTVNKSVLFAFGASPYSVEEQRLLSRSELDEVCPNKAFAMIKYDGHACIINTKLLNKLKKKISKLRGYHPETGEMNQEAFFEVTNYISSKASIPSMFKNMQKAIDYCVHNGIGMIHSVSGVGYPFNFDINIEQIFAKSLQNGVELRIFPQSMNIKTAKRRHLNRIGGCFKCALDGCFGSQDAALYEPYINNKENTGVLYYTDEQVIDFCKKANRAGLQIEMHAIGDRAFDQAARALKAALDDFPREDHRHGIIHCCLPTKDGIEICKKYKIQMPVQSSFINWKQEPVEYLDSILGKRRVKKLNPLKTYIQNGILISAGSDAPCTDPNPIEWIDQACNNGKESLSVEQALRMCTYNGYMTSFDEKECGSLEVGKKANMVILSADPFKVNNLKELKVEDTILDGKSYCDQKQAWPKIVLKGIFTRRKV